MSQQPLQRKVRATNNKEAANVDIRGELITRGILAVLAATIIACGSASAGSASHERGGGGSAYITADAEHGVGLQTGGDPGGGIGAPGDALGGPQLQP
jgi:hypothetical protein